MTAFQKIIKYLAIAFALFLRINGNQEENKYE